MLLRSDGPSKRAARVAGADVPAFVERVWSQASRDAASQVSPGLMSRPSLSEAVGPLPVGLRLHVSPGLMSRPSLSAREHLRADGTVGVSPGLMSRPSLSETRIECTAYAPTTSVAGADVPAFVERVTQTVACSERADVSPGLMSRPSLSAVPRHRRRARGAGVAGADVPAFVERGPGWPLASAWCSCRRG